MGDDQRAQAIRAAFPDAAEDRGLMLQVQHGRWFIEHQIAGLLSKHACQQDAASLATAQFGEATAAQRHGVNRAQGFIHGFGLACAGHAAAERDGFFDREGETGFDFLRQKADALGALARVPGAQALPLQRDLRASKQADQSPRQGALAGTVRTEHAQHLASFEAQIEAAQHRASAVSGAHVSSDQCHRRWMIAAYNGRMSLSAPTSELVRQRLQQAQQTYAALGEDFVKVVEQAAEWGIEALQRAKGGIYILGNGGSAADAQHWAAELVGRYLTERDPLNVHALTVNSSTFTALVNDYPPEEVFERQVRAHVGPGDLLLAISTSGNSENVLRAVRAAKIRGARVVGVSGKSGGKLAPICDLTFIAPSEDTPRIQEAHLLFGHCFCELVEQAFTSAG